MSQVSTEFIPTRIAILTVSNRRGEEDDTSGHYLRDSAQEAGHHVVDKAIVKENRYAIRAQVSAWIASDDVQVVLITGGTGLTEGDQAPDSEQWRHGAVAVEHGPDRCRRGRGRDCHGAAHCGLLPLGDVADDGPV